MLHYTEFIADFMNRYDYPPEAIETFTRVLKRLDEEKEFGDKMDKLVEGYMYPWADNMQEYLNGVIELSKEYGLYRQDYCGCAFSKAEAERRKENKK